MRDYHRLQVWQRAFAHARAIRGVVDRFPRRGYADTKAQMRSSAESVVNNIVEGCGAESNAEFARFLSMAIKSAVELEGQLELALSYGIIADAAWARHSRETIEIRRMLHGLRKRLLES
jgi:four helix bundle protein